jgi:hypothetical protein
MTGDRVMVILRASFLGAVFLAPLTSCGPQPSPEVHAPEVMARKGVTEVEPIEDSRVRAGQTLYVPAYSSVYISDRAEKFDLAVTLGVRNVDRAHPIVVTAVRYHDQDGQLVRDFLKRPLRIAPMASVACFVAESDRSGGVLASFLVEWVAEQEVTAPIVESVMIGTASSRGISFTYPGRVVANRGQSGLGDRTSR